MIVGLFALYFVGPYEAARLHADPNSIFVKMVPFFILGFVLLIACSRLPKTWLIRICVALGAVGLILILKTLVAPEYVNGSARYVRLGGTVINPFVITLPAYIVLMSRWLGLEKPKTWTAILTTLFIMFAAIHAPNVFMAQVYFLLFLVMGFRARKNAPIVFYSGLAILAVLVLFMMLAASCLNHVQLRLMNGNDLTGISLDAIKHSALFGGTSESGVALSKLPFVTTDFMVTGIIAKFGFLIGAFVLFLYGLITRGLIKAIRTTSDKFFKMLSVGTLALFAIYAIAAISVAFGLITTSACLPFISFGGTMLVTWCVLFGFVLSGTKNN